MTHKHSLEEIAYYERLVEGLDEKAARRKLGQYGRTPQALFDALHAEFQFTLDGAANIWDAKLPRLNSEASPDKFPWAGERVFLNVPFGDVAQFAKKACYERAELVVCIGPASTCSGWFHSFVMGKATEVRCPDHRIEFDPPPLVEYSNNARDTVITIWRPGGGIITGPIHTQFIPCDPETGRDV